MNIMPTLFATIPQPHRKTIILLYQMAIFDMVQSDLLDIQQNCGKHHQRTLSRDYCWQKCFDATDISVNRRKLEVNVLVLRR
jgi:hypothetical protein